MEKKGVVPGLYRVVRRAYTVASFAALVQGGCTACYVISVPLVLCSSLFGTLVFLGVRRTMSAREEERTQEKGRRRRGGGKEGRRRPGGGQEEGPPTPKLQDSSRGVGMFYSIVFHSILFDLNSVTVYVFYSYLFSSNSIECIPFPLEGGLCLGLYLACTIGCTLLLDHFWLLRPPVPPVLLGCSFLLLIHTDQNTKRPPQK